MKKNLLELEVEGPVSTYRGVEISTDNERKHVSFTI